MFSYPFCCCSIPQELSSCEGWATWIFVSWWLGFFFWLNTQKLYSWGNFGSLWESTLLTSIVAGLVQTLTGVHNSSFIPTLTTFVACFLTFWRDRWNFNVGSTCISLMAHEIEHFTHFYCYLYFIFVGLSDHQLVNFLFQILNYLCIYVV